MYYAANKDKICERRKQQYWASPERPREKSRRWAAVDRRVNPEKSRDQQRRFYGNHPEKVKERNLRWRQANPEKFREMKRTQARHRRAIKMRATFPGLPRTTAVAVALRRQLFNNSCAYCGGPGPFHDDHVEPLSRGGLDTPINLVPACQRCNNSKWAKPVEAWYLSQPFFCPDRWAALKRHTGRKWSEVEQLTLLEPPGNLGELGSRVNSIEKTP